MNVKMLIQYDGSRYEGWQRQERTGNTIQGRLEETLGKLTGAAVEIQGAGRTDAGVHAAGQTAHVHLPDNTDLDVLCAKCNHYLPEDIAVVKMEQVPERFHSRYHAKGKRYVYRIGTGMRKHVFERKYIYDYGEELDVEAMRRAAELLTGKHDFRSFCGNKRMKKSTVRTVFSIDIEEKDGEICITYMGDGFLQHMVRILSGTLLEVGSGGRLPESMTGLLEAKDREKAGFTAPAKGLILLEVLYDSREQ